MQQALDGSRAILTWPLLFAICFMLVFSVVIALFKDLPDIEGDRQVSVFLCLTLTSFPSASYMGTSVNTGNKFADACIDTVCV